MTIRLQRLAISAVLLAIAATGMPVSLASAAAPKVLTDQQLGFFDITRSELLEHVKRVGIIPAYMPAGFGDRDDVKTLFEDKVTTYLKKAGFDVVGRESYQAIYDRLNRQVGGVYDPNTGAARTAQWTAVAEDARREFMEKEHLDAYVLVRIMPAKANFQRDIATWDGASERTDGLLVTNFLSGMLHQGNSSGTLPGYSLLLQFGNPGQKIIYGRMGAIQLGTYYRIGANKDPSDFRAVPPDNLFRDEQRIERAVRLATYPLLFSAEQIAEADKSLDPAVNPYSLVPARMPAPPSADPAPPPSALKVPREQILANVHRVALTRLVNVGGVTVSPEVADRYTELVRTELKGLGWDVVETTAAPQMFGAEVIAGGGLYDPLTGHVRNDRLAEIWKAIFPKIGMIPPPDAVLWMHLQRRTMTHRFGDVFWDGVSQSAIDLAPVRPGLFGSRSVAAGDASIQTLSVAFALRDPNAALLYESRGGIQVLQQLQGEKLTTLAPGELFQDPGRDVLAVHAALDELAAAPAPPAPAR